MAATSALRSTRSETIIWPPARPSRPSIPSPRRCAWRPRHHRDAFSADHHIVVAHLRGWNAPLAEDSQTDGEQGGARGARSVEAGIEGVPLVIDGRRDAAVDDVEARLHHEVMPDVGGDEDVVA